MYVLLYERIKDKKHISGLCHCIEDLREYGDITYSELQILSYHFQNEFPTSFFFKLLGTNAKFRREKSFNRGCNGQGYWWTSEGTEQRKLFIKHLIEKTK